jgi:hypothetical protein
VLPADGIFNVETHSFPKRGSGIHPQTDSFGVDLTMDIMLRSIAFEFNQDLLEPLVCGALLYA